MLNYFECVKGALNASVAAVAASRNLSDVQVKTLLSNHLETMNKEWFSGELPNIAYEDPVLRLAYMFCHVAANANLFETVICHSQPIKELVASRAAAGQLEICAFGGGLSVLTTFHPPPA